MERVDKLLAGTGHWSRKEVKDLVRQGRVYADGIMVKKSEEKVSAETVLLEVDKKRVECVQFVYLMLH